MRDNNNKFIKSINIENNMKLITLLTCKELIDQALSDPVVNLMHEGALITSIMRLYLYAEIIYLLSKNSTIYQAIQSLISDLSIKAIKELKKPKDSQEGDNEHQ